MSNKLKIGIIGMGRMGITHYSIINSHPNVEIVSIADPSPLVLAIMRKYFFVKLFKDYNQLFRQTMLDAVLVCTPPQYHFSIIKKAAEKGVHVFVEKPFTTTINEASELNRIFSVNGLTNQVGYVNRFNDVFLKLKEFIDDGIVGKIVRFKSEMYSCSITRSNKNSGWRSSRESGGGALLEMASHAIDLVNFLIGKPDKVIGSSLNYIYSKNVEDIVSSTFIYKSGISGTLYINWSDSSYRKPINKIEIFGTSGKIIADQHTLKVFLNNANKKHNLHRGWNNIYITDIFTPVNFYVRGNEFTSQLYHFVDCLQDRGIINRCSFADGLNTLEIIENISNDYKQNGI